MQSRKELVKSGLVLGFLLNLIFFIFPLLIKKQINYEILILSILIIIISIIKPYILRYPLMYWIKFGNIAARINSTIVLAIFFYFLIVPFSLVRYVIKKLTLFKKSVHKSYYEKTDINKSSNLKDQY